MQLTNNLLYLLLLFAVLDKDNRLNVTNGILIALGLMLINFFCNPVIRCRELDNDRNCSRRRLELDPFLILNDI